MKSWKRKTRQVFAWLLAVLCTLALVGVSGVKTGYAEEKKIKITISGVGITAANIFDAYRILNAAVNTDGSVAYTLDDKYKELVLQAARDASGNTGIDSYDKLKAFITDHKDSANSTEGEDKVLRDFANRLYRSLKNAGTEKDVELKGGENQLPLDQAGWYLLSDSSPEGAEIHDYSTTILVGLIDPNTEVNINVKSSTPELHKKVKEKNDSEGTETGYVDAADYDIGDMVPFMITGVISREIESFEKYTYKFVDTLPESFTLDQSSIKVQVEKVAKGDYAKGVDAADKVDLKLGDDYTVSVEGRKLTVNMTSLLELVKGNKIEPGDTVVVTYNAKLNEKAVIGNAGNENTVRLTYSNNPYTKDEGESTDRRSKVYTYQLRVFKTGKNNTALAGAGFTLQKKIDGEYKDVAILNSQDLTQKAAEQTVVTELVEKDIKNEFRFSGLDAGEYKLIESTVPAGYLKAEDLLFTIKTDFKDQNTAAAALNSFEVTDVSGGEINTQTADGNITGILSTTVHNNSESDFILPKTGGVGKLIFFGAGAAAVLAGILLPAKKRRKSEEEA